MEILKNFYTHLHASISQLFIFLILQGILFCILGVLILVFPYGLIVFTSIFFLIIGMFSVWVAIKVEAAIKRLEGLRDLLKWKK